MSTKDCRAHSDALRSSVLAPDWPQIYATEALGRRSEKLIDGGLPFLVSFL